MPPKLYTQDISPPARAVMLTESALGIKLTHHKIDLAAVDHLKPQFIQRNPQHTIPTLELENGTVLWDSHAIMAFLVGKYGEDDSLYPKDLVYRAKVDQRLHFDSGTVFPIISNIFKAMFFNGVKTVHPDEIEKALRAYGFLDVFLQGQNWVAGNQVTIADFSLITSITGLNCVVPIDVKYENIWAWIRRAEAWPYYEVNAKGNAELDEAFKRLMK